jgi:hypothetical protein
MNVRKVEWRLDAALILMVLGLALALFASPAHAQFVRDWRGGGTEVPSAVSGDYAGSGWACRLEAGRQAIPGAVPPVAPRGLRWACVDPAGLQRLGYVAWSELDCPTLGAAALMLFTADPYAPSSLFLRIVGRGPGYIDVVVGSTPQRWALVQAVAPAWPYPGCGQ